MVVKGNGKAGKFGKSIFHKFFWLVGTHTLFGSYKSLPSRDFWHGAAIAGPRWAKSPPPMF
jgi:hypothetical protein